MALDRKTIRIILIVAAVVLISGIIIGLVVGLAGPPQGVHLGFIPMDKSTGNLIQYKPNDKASVLKWTNIIDDSLKDYSGKAAGAENRASCSYSMGPSSNLVCDVPVHEYHPCVADNQYNYHRAAPCVFLQLNKMLSWTPEPYNTTENLPDEMPSDLKQQIAVTSGKPEANAVWVSCEGVNPTDVEYMGPIQYIPRRGFPTYYFPYKGQEGYLSPLVAVLFERPASGVVVTVECKAWAKNIFRNETEQQGSVFIELMVDI